ncbi:MAG TPA: zinc-ribbon and DUF3426 domain-containing protein [Gammaproteobacteria bacterium]|nr:zinc-ribbon and DUF3426 domain-containing protein [Gammaproteobacteria bacterium]
MYTQCSSCATLFHVTSQHLRQAQGLVRCCLCHEVFDALPSLVESLPAGLEVESPAHAAQPGFIGPEVVKHAVESASSPLDDDFFTTLPTTDIVAPEAPVAAPVGRQSGVFGWSAGFLLLLVVLTVPYGYLMREELARYPRLRPWVEGLCAVARCELPLLRDISRVHILYKDVGVHSASSAGLLVTATLVNDAGFRQPYPQIRFSFLDPVGAVQSSRWYSPDDYLNEQQKLEAAAGMPPQEPVSVRLAVADIDTAAVDNFAIDLR